MVDEIQNVVATAQRTNRIKPLIRFLTELTNDTCTAVYFTGTTLAETVFQSEEYLRRRTRGPRLLPFKPDGAYRAFLQALWPYQYTPEQAVLTDRLANQIYDYSGGIPAYISKLLEEAQAQALMRGVSRIDHKMIAAAADYLAIQPPKELGTGTFLSDFQAPAAGSMEHLTDTPTQQEAEDTPEDTSPVKRLYAVPRGKAAERDERDLLTAFKAGDTPGAAAVPWHGGGGGVMLTWFPSPYPDELFYSVLCRYYLSSGIKEHYLVKKQLFGTKAGVKMATLYPNATIHAILSQLPEKVFDGRDMILHHTPFLYYARMYPQQEREALLDDLLQGRGKTPTHLWKTFPKDDYALRYCPLCIQEDTKIYGGAVLPRRAPDTPLQCVRPASVPAEADCHYESEIIHEQPLFSP